jgi:hypothetical protein
MLSIINSNRYDCGLESPTVLSWLPYSVPQIKLRVIFSYMFNLSVNFLICNIRIVISTYRVSVRCI